MTTYWVELSLLTSLDQPMLEEFVAALRKDHSGQVLYTSVGPSLTLVLIDQSDEKVEQVICRVAGTVRASAHALGLRTPGWPEPVHISDVRAKTLAEDDADCGVSEALPL